MRIFNRLTVLIIFIIAIAIYWTTSYPSITLWESSEYSAAAACFGVTCPPGSIILTFFGWTLSKLYTNNPAFVFNLFAGLVASLTVILSYLAFKKILSIIAGEEKINFTFIENLSIIITSGIIICSTTLWEYATMFTPYILTALFTLLILLSVLNWWIKADNKTSWKNIFLITLLLGVDFSVHRTNAILIPGILVIMIIRKPKIFLSFRSYLAAIAGIIIGLSIQFLYIPMSLNDPAFNMGETNTLTSWWDFISIKQYGGNFLTAIFVRKGPLWTYQVPYYLKGFANNFFYFNHNTIVLGYFPALLGLTGIVYLFKYNRKIAIALVSFFLITIASSILYFNLPENYFRSIYRHYLPTYIVFSVFIFCGAFFIIRKLADISNKLKFIYITIALLVIAATAITQFATNWKYRDCSKQTFVVDFTKNVFNSIDENGIYISLGDNNCFPEMYLQVGEKQRADIIVCNIYLLSLDWNIKQYQRHRHDFPFKGDNIDFNKWVYNKWITQYCSIPISDFIRAKYNTKVDTVHLSMPALRENNSNYLGDLVLYDILKTNKWEKPIYFFKGFDDNDVFYKWLKPYLCDEGLVYKFVPDTSLHINISAIETNLNKFIFQGYNNNSILLEDDTKAMSQLYYDMFINVIKYKISIRDLNGATKYLNQMKYLLPFDRLQADEKIIKETKELEKSIKINVR